MGNRIIIPDASTQPREYVAALLHVLGDRDPIRVYRDSVTQVTGLVDGLSADEWHAPLPHAEWNPYEVVGHLVDVDIVYGFRWRLMLTSDHPAYPGYDERRWAKLPKPPPEGLVSAFRGLRGLNSTLIETVSKDAWSRTAVHSEQGEETVAIMIRKIAGHDIAHLDQLSRSVAQARRAPRTPR